MTSTTRPPESAVTGNERLLRFAQMCERVTDAEDEEFSDYIADHAAADVRVIIARLDSAERALTNIAESAGPFRERGTSGDGHARCIDIATAHFKAIP